jgi:hypothetical protein
MLSVNDCAIRLSETLVPEPIQFLTILVLKCLQHFGQQ